MASPSASSSPRDIPTVKLRNGVEMPRISLGLAFWNVEKGKLGPHNPRFTGFLPEQCYRSLHLALQAGIRALDTALIYRTHSAVRQVLGSWFAEGKLKRDDIFITTKVMHPLAPIATAGSHMADYDTMTVEQVAAKVKEHVELCLHELGMGYVDLMLLHWPAHFDSKNADNRAKRFAAWKVLESYYDRGWFRAVGVSNWTEHHLRQLAEDGATITPMVNQIEGSVYLQWDDIVEYCRDHGIVVEAFSPLGHGAASVVSDGVVLGIASKHSKDAGQIAMRYLVQKGYALTFSTGSEKRLRTNQEIFDFELDENEMKQLDALNGTAPATGQPSPYDMS